MLSSDDEIEQLKEVKPQPPNCPICPVCSPRPKPWQICLKIFLLLTSGIFIALIILASSGLRIIRKESLLDIWLAKRKGITPTVLAPEPIPTADSYTNWKTYTNKEYGFELKYPEEMSVEEKKEKEVWFWKSVYRSTAEPTQHYNPDVLFILRADNLEGGTSEAYIKKALGFSLNKTLESFFQEMDWDYSMETDNRIYFHQKEGPGEGTFHNYISSGDYVVDIKTFSRSALEDGQFSRILSTFKFLDKEGNYPRPSSWKTVKIEGLGISLCLPPKWEEDKFGNVYFNRDPSYRPHITHIQKLPASTSAKEAYLNFWEGEYPAVRQKAVTRELDVNGKTLLVFDYPEGEKIVWVVQNKFFQAGISGWEWVSSSKTNFLNNFYTMVGCSML
jgi:hypothetical protein